MSGKLDAFHRLPMSVPVARRTQDHRVPRKTDCAKAKVSDLRWKYFLSDLSVEKSHLANLADHS